MVVGEQGVNRVVDDGEVLANALAWADELAARAPRALALTKRSFRAAAETGLAAAAAYEAQLQGRLMATEDFQEGVAALVMKRAPAFKGR